MQQVIRLLSVICVLFVFSDSCDAQDAKAKKKKPNPVFALPEIDPNLPNVLLIGDSISIGYTLDVRRELKGKANVFRPPTNCGPTTRGLEQVDAWIGDRKWDVIHFNFGLHDLKYMGPNGENLAKPGSEGAHQQVAIEQYQVNIGELAARFKETGAKVIWRETSPVPEGSKGRVPGDSAKYNAAAAKAVAKVGGIVTDPFYAFAQSVSDTQKPANVHYTPEGSKKLGIHVAERILEAIK
ncbi:MAG: SGNH/GDSL hydrolase family protein [Planctomycetota bacterium]